MFLDFSRSITDIILILAFFRLLALALKFVFFLSHYSQIIYYFPSFSNSYFIFSFFLSNRILLLLLSSFCFFFSLVQCSLLLSFIYLLYLSLPQSLLFHSSLVFFFCILPLKKPQSNRFFFSPPEENLTQLFLSKFYLYLSLRNFLFKYDFGRCLYIFS